jgi:hypothetical protein
MGLKGRDEMYKSLKTFPMLGDEIRGRSIEDLQTDILLISEFVE